MINRFLLALAASLTISVSLAQELQAPIPFENGQLSIARNDDDEHILSFNGKNIESDGLIQFNRVETVAGQPVAIFSAGAGGNVCDPNALLVWMADGAIKTERVGEDDCSVPEPTLEGDRLVFIPAPAPGGDALPIRSWSPKEGEKVTGQKSFEPDAGSSWADVVPGKYTHPQDFFKNADIYPAAKILLGQDLGDVALALSLASEPKTTASGLLYGSGCVPHACTVSDGFIGIDPAAKKLYFAIGPLGPEMRIWPAANQWPTEMQAAMNEALKL